MPKRKTAAKSSRASSSPKKAHYAGSEKRMAVGSPELRKLISRKQKARWRRHFAEHPETPRKPRRAKLPHDEVHERRAASHHKPVVGIFGADGRTHPLQFAIGGGGVSLRPGRDVERHSRAADHQPSLQRTPPHRLRLLLGVPASRTPNDA